MCRRTARRDVVDLEAHVLHAPPFGVLTRAGDHPLATSTPWAWPPADQLGKLDGRVPEPAANVKHTVTWLGMVLEERCVAVCPRVRDDDCLEVLPDVKQGAVPSLGRLEILGRDMDLGHRTRVYFRSLLTHVRVGTPTPRR